MDASILEALSTASASTVVSFTLESTPITLFASLDVKNGGLQWLQESREDGAILRHVHTKKWLIPMLNDRPRNKCYADAIRQSFRPTGGVSGEAARAALDVGTGSGLLAMLVAKRFEEVRRVVTLPTQPPFLHLVFARRRPQAAADPDHHQVLSVEMSEPMATLARRIIECNGLHGRIKVSALHSTLLPPPSPPDPPYAICTSELLDYQLVGEGIIPTLRDLHSRRVLSKDTVVVPSGARIHARVLSQASGFKKYCDPPTSYGGGLKLPPRDPNSSPPVVPFQPTRLPQGSYLTPAFDAIDFAFDDYETFPAR